MLHNIVQRKNTDMDDIDITLILNISTKKKKQKNVESKITRRINTVDDRHLKET